MGVLVILLAFTALLATKLDSPIHSDTARDLVQAAACAHGNAYMCNAGPGASFFGLTQGALWIRFLTLGYELNASLVAMEIAALAFIALGAGVVAVIARRWAGPASVLPASAAFIFFSQAAAEYPVFWNPSLLPLPAAVFTWALLEHARVGKTMTALLAAIALAACIDLHLIFFVLVPFLFIVTVASAGRPLRSVLLVFLGLGATLALDSPRAWAQNIDLLANAGSTWPLAVLPPVATASSLLARHYWQRLEPSRRVVVLITILVAWSAVPLLTFRTAPRYYAPSLPALSLGFGWLIGNGLSRHRFSARALLAATALFFFVKESRRLTREQWMTSSTWSLSELASLVPAIEQHGIRNKAANTRIEGLSIDELTSLVGSGRFSDPLESFADQREPLADTHSLLVVRAPRSALPSPTPREWSLVDLNADSVSVLRPLAPFLRRDRMRACYGPLHVEAKCFDVAYRPDMKALDFPPFAELPRLMAPAALAELGEFRAELWLDLDTGASGPSHVVEIVDKAPGWQIAAVEGVAYEGELPSRRIVVHAGSGRGRLAFVHRYEAGARPTPYWPPLVIETLPEEVALRELLGSTHSSHGRIFGGR